jgi:hypothetical protein
VWSFPPAGAAARRRPRRLERAGRSHGALTRAVASAATDRIVLRAGGERSARCAAHRSCGFGLHHDRPQLDYACRTSAMRFRARPRSGPPRYAARCDPAWQQGRRATHDPRLGARRDSTTAGSRDVAKDQRGAIAHRAAGAAARGAAGATCGTARSADGAVGAAVHQSVAQPPLRRSPRRRVPH